MSQSDMNVANASGAAVRADINANLDALVTLSSAPTEPSTKFANMWWADTSTSLLKRRNNANTAWISVMGLATGLIIGTDVAPVASPSFTGTLASAGIIYLPTLGLASPQIDILAGSTATAGTAAIDMQSGNGAGGQRTWGIENNQVNNILEFIDQGSSTTIFGAAYQGGIFVGTATGGAKGAGTINATEYYKNGTVLSSGATLGTEQSTASGTSWTFGSIPAGTTEIKIMFEGSSFTTDVDFLVQIGDAGGIEATGYDYLNTALAATPSDTTSTTSFFISDDAGNGLMSGVMTLSLKDSANFTWMAEHTSKNSLGQSSIGTGFKSLSAELTQLKISGGTGDAGSVNISYS